MRIRKTWEIKNSEFAIQTGWSLDGEQASTVAHESRD